MNPKYPKTSLRMQLLLEASIVGSPLWDMCCDHGQLGIEALMRGDYGLIHFVDRVPSIANTLSNKLQFFVSKGLSSHYKIYCQDAETLTTSIEGTCIIAGVGGKTISSILYALLVRGFLNANRLVLSAHSDEALMLNFLDSEDFKKNYQIVDKLEVSDRLKIRSIYVLDRT